MSKRSATVTAIIVVVLWLGVLPAGAQSADELFASQTLQRLDLYLHSADWSKLKAAFETNTYYPADLVWNAQTVRNTGIRSRGRGSRSGTKPGLRVDFDRYSSGQTFLGLKSLVLDNLTQDASGVHESVSAAFYARLGIPVSREIHTRLYVNNDYVGVYVIVESVDKDLLARVFGAIGDDTQNDGHLYEYKWNDDWRFTDLGSSLDPYKLRFEATTHESETDGFLGSFGLNNFYLYRLENSEIHTLISWDSDNTFYSTILSINEGWSGNPLMEKLMTVPEYNGLYVSEITRTALLAEADEWLNTEIIRQVQRVDTAMKEDPSKPFSNEAYEGRAGEMLNFARARIAFVKCELANGVGNTSCRTR